MVKLFKRLFCKHEYVFVQCIEKKDFMYNLGAKCFLMTVCHKCGKEKTFVYPYPFKDIGFRRYLYLKGVIFDPIMDDLVKTKK